MDYEKSYKEALERARKIENGEPINVPDGTSIPVVIFPELKESEDEQIRKWIIDDIRYNINNEPLNNSEYKKKAEKAIAWLEKQCNQKSSWSEEDEHRIKDAIYFLDTAKKHYASTVEIDACIDWIKSIKQKFNKEKVNNANKVEPKFNEGDWVVFNNKHQSIYQIEKIEDGYYNLRHTHGGTFRVCVLHDESLRLWTIKDAKDGDVLACNEEILLFKSYSVQQGRISLYCWYNGHTNNFHSKEVVDILLTTTNKVCPATKEQRDLLFQKMKEAGYEWDADKKELKKL